MMKKNSCFTDPAGITSIILLVILLVALTVSMLCTVIQNTDSTEQFDPLDLASEKKDVSPYSGHFLIPEFIGIKSGSRNGGLYSSGDTVADIYSTISPFISSVMCQDNRTDADDTLWRELSGQNAFIYMRYHYELPACAVRVFADMSSANESGALPSGSVYEMIIPAYSANEGGRIAVRDSAGNVSVYKGESRTVITSEDMSKTLRSYRTAFNAFSFTETEASPTCPLINGIVETRNMIITEGTAGLILNSTSELSGLLSVFSLNTNKLLSTHDEDDGTLGYVDSEGAVYVRDTYFEYTAASDSGIEIDELTGSSEMTAANIVSASLAMINKLTKLNSNYTGGDAGMVLSSLSAEDGKVKISFAYTFDNLRILGGIPAFTAEYENGFLKSAVLYTVAARKLDSKAVLDGEERYYLLLKKSRTVFFDVCPVYRNDFISDSISPEWCTLVREADDDETQ